ncbi:type II secretion system F family protein [Nocardia terpenica]|uniref:Type II secretion system protein GspF domain-containing protein n=1 Tax=Nocardia terpenica TaxID=455432 RepID=A0A6G9ZB35_9NOCA|nr:type II secretion system F family protein [Nocardia terpenica]QIS22815.1 hypothetical protein F6W96_35245 [Nocardia terpenica]
MNDYRLAVLGVDLALLVGGYLIYRGRRAAVVAPEPKAGVALWDRMSARTRIRLAIGLFVGVAGWVTTGWLAWMVAGPLALVVLPQIFGPTAAAGRIERLDALEEWVRNLAGVASVGNGLEQSILATERSVPDQLRPEVSALLAAVRANAPVTEALRRFADAVDDASADAVVAALLQVASLRGSGLTTILEGLSVSIAEDVRNRREIEAKRKQTVTSVRYTTIIIVGLLAYLFAATDYLAAYRHGGLQLLFTGLLAAFGGLLLWMRAIVRHRPRTRFIQVRHREPAGSPS